LLRKVRQVEKLPKYLILASTRYGIIVNLVNIVSKNIAEKLNAKQLIIAAANAENAAGVPDKIRNKWNKMLSGERLAPQQKKNFINQSGSIFKGQIISQNRFDKSMVDAAKSRGVATDQSIFTKFDIPNDVLEKSFARLGIENKKTVIPKNLQKTHSVLSKLTGSKNKADIMNRIDEIMKKRKNTANTGFKRSGMSGREL